MRSLRFLLSRRWIIFFLVVTALAYAAWWLGEWQFGRLHDRKDSNAVIERNEDAAPAPVADVLAPGRPVAADDEWRRVTATGTYAVDDTVIVRYRTRDSDPGVDVLVPLVTADGTALLVDRGWMPAENAGSADVTPPAPPAGEVTVVGWVRQDGSGASTRVEDQSTRAVSSLEVAKALDLRMYAGFIELDSEDPAPAESLEPVELPDLGEGPHFFYGLQWWFFGLLAVVGFVYLAYDEWRGERAPRAVPQGRPRAAAVRPRRKTLRDRLDAMTAPESERLEDHRDRAQSERSIPPSTGTIAPVTNDDAGDSRNAATRPNSSGRP